MRRKSHKASLFYRTVKKQEYNNVKWLLETTPNIDFNETVNGVCIMKLVEKNQPLRNLITTAKIKQYSKPLDILTQINEELGLYD